METTQVNHQLIKISTAWFGVAFSVSDIASFLAIIYTSILIGEWIYKKMKGR
jgi:hypothetical protein